MPQWRREEPQAAGGGAEGFVPPGYFLCVVRGWEHPSQPTHPGATFGVGGSVGCTGALLIGCLWAGAGPRAVEIAARLGYGSRVGPHPLWRHLWWGGRCLPRRRDGGWLATWGVGLRGSGGRGDPVFYAVIEGCGILTT